jgi:hypothetical protein
MPECAYTVLRWRVLAISSTIRCRSFIRCVIGQQISIQRQCWSDSSAVS